MTIIPNFYFSQPAVNLQAPFAARSGLSKKKLTENMDSDVYPLQASTYIFVFFKEDEFKEHQILQLQWHSVFEAGVHSVFRAVKRNCWVILAHCGDSFHGGHQRVVGRCKQR